MYQSIGQEGAFGKSFIQNCDDLVGQEAPSKKLQKYNNQCMNKACLPDS